MCILESTHLEKCIYTTYIYIFFMYKKKYICINIHIREYTSGKIVYTIYSIPDVYSLTHHVSVCQYTHTHDLSLSLSPFLALYLCIEIQWYKYMYICMCVHM